MARPVERPRARDRSDLEGRGQRDIARAGLSQVVLMAPSAQESARLGHVRAREPEHHEGAGPIGSVPEPP